MDGAGDEEITPSEIAVAIGSALADPELGSGRERTRRFLGDALDAVADGMSPDYVAMILNAALGSLDGGARTA